LDTNHGFAKVAVENSEVAKRRTHLEQRLARLKRWAQSAGKREAQASRRRERLLTAYNTRSKELYRELTAYQFTLEEQSLPEYVFLRKLKERKAEIDAELEPLRCKEWQTYEQCNAEFRKQERYCQEQRAVLRVLEDLKEQERTMYELDNRKAQVMTVCKVAVANLAMWVHDRYFPPSYAQATWKHLLPFFQLPGTITQDSTIVQVELCSMIAHSIEIWQSSVSVLTRHRLACLMDAASCLSFVPHVAFLLRRRKPKYRESLISTC
jgi:hypothetical protein